MISLKQLNNRLDAGKIVRMPVAQWDKLAPEFELVDTVETGLAGQILLVRRKVSGRGKKPAWALVEEPAPNERVIRPLANEKEARALIADRLATYERMWDG